MRQKVKTLFRMAQTGQARFIPFRYYYRWLAARAVESTRPVSSDSTDDVGIAEAHFLSPSRSYADLLYSAKSLIHHYPERLRLFIHFDNVPTDTVLNRVKHHLPNARLTTRPERDRLINPWLAERGFRTCQEFRRVNVMAIKLIDVLALARSDRFMLIDTDVLSFARLDQFAHWHNTARAVNTFGRDPVSHPYCLSKEDIQSRFGVEIKRTDAPTLTPSAVVPSRISRNTVASSLSTGSSTRAVIL
jgi:hypothetical protein